MSLYVDTSAWYAAADGSDRSNARAKDILRWRLGRPAAERFFDGIRNGVADLVNVTAADLENAWGIATAFPDQDFSLVDRTSFAVMERLGIERVASFDHDFAIYRYGRRRDRAFVVVR